MMYAFDYNSYLPPTGWNCGYTGLISPYTNEKADLVIYGNSYCNKIPHGIYYCPSTPAPASSSPVWDGGILGEHSLSNYIQTMKRVDDLNARNQGAWTLVDGTFVLSDKDQRRLDQIKSGTVIMSEQNYYGRTGGFWTVNTCISHLRMDNNLWTNLAYAPAWNYHGKSANFLFLDGHISPYSYTGQQLFDNDWIPK